MPAATSRIVRPALPTGREIYDTLMGAIEPDLLIAHVDGLEQRYARETVDDYGKRMERYRKAFDEYDRQYAEYMSALSQQVTTYRKVSRKALEEETRAEEAAHMSSLEHSMHSQN